MVSPSVTNEISHTPVIPHIAGNIRIQINRITKPLADEITADSFAQPIEVK